MLVRHVDPKHRPLTTQRKAKTDAEVWSHPSPAGAPDPPAVHSSSSRKFAACRAVGSAKADPFAVPIRVAPHAARCFPAAKRSAQDHGHRFAFALSFSPHQKANLSEKSIHEL